MQGRHSASLRVCSLFCSVYDKIIRLKKSFSNKNRPKIKFYEIPVESLVQHLECFHGNGDAVDYGSSLGNFGWAGGVVCRI